MINSMLRRNVVFVAGWVVAGLAIALLVNLLWRHDRALPEVVAPAAPAAESAPISPAVVAAQVENASASEITPVAPVPAAVGPSSYASAVRVSAPAVVSINTLSKVRLSSPRVLQGPDGRRVLTNQALQPGLGSGVIVDNQGHIVTNHHVIADADQIVVELSDGRSANAQVVGTDPDTDLAVLKIDLPKLPVMNLGRSDRLAVGDVVLAIGNPFGLSQTVTQGIVSATGRALLDLSTFEDFIQTDAVINKGNSGGALVNARGELVGINTAVLGDKGSDGFGVAIPVDLVRGVMHDILQYGKVVRGWIGVALGDASELDARQNNLPSAGVVIMGLHPQSPALKAGLAQYDVIKTIDGQTVRNRQDTLARIASRKPGSSVRISGLRKLDKQPFTVDLHLIESPEGTN